MGPILFNLFINDIVNIPGCKKILFADDTVLYVEGNTFCECIEDIKSILKHLSEWLFENKLLANESKTKLMLISRHRVPDLPVIFFNNVALEWVSNIKYLGTIIDNKLKFNEHVNYICTRLSQMKGIFYSLSHFVPRDILINIYSGLVYPIITYNIVVWGGVNRTATNRINVLINGILRHILRVKFQNYRPDISTSDMYKNLSILKFKDVYKMFLLKFIHKVYYDRTDIFEKFFSPLLPQTTYST